MTQPQRDGNENYVIFRQPVCVKKQHKVSRLFANEKFIFCNSLGSALSFAINEQHFSSRLSLFSFFRVANYADES